ncbi:hypothetical protein M758_3G132500 [Ceratodon purpureus]|nr:hypothetical protein M758_3G132500 [Ceratodon purpureus]
MTLLLSKPNTVLSQHVTPLHSTSLHSTPLYFSNWLYLHTLKLQHPSPNLQNTQQRLQASRHTNLSNPRTHHATNLLIQTGSHFPMLHTPHHRNLNHATSLHQSTASIPPASVSNPLQNSPNRDSPLFPSSNRRGLATKWLDS